MNLERRSFPAELRAERDHGKTFLTGKAAGYGTLSLDLGGFYEVLQAGCFDEALAAGDDCVHNLNHDPNLILGRTGSGSTVLESRADGLFYRTLLPMTSYVKDLLVLMERGDFNESSFAFEVGEGNDVWDVFPDPANPKRQAILRTITGIKRLWDVSTCFKGAYPQTSATIADRTLPASMPAEYRSMVLAGGDVPTRGNSRDMRAIADDDTDSDESEQCSCDCEACLDGSCQDCSDPDCTDEFCLAAVRVRYYELDMRLKNHVATQPIDDSGRAARARKLQLAQASW